MEILRNVNDVYVSMLGINPIDMTKSYRWNKLITSVDIDDGKVMFNGLTRAIIFLTNDELESICDIKTYEFLYRAYFLVDTSFDEYQAVKNIRSKLQIPVDDLYLSKVNRYTILTTLACNARCNYCYELGIKSKHSMTSNTAIQIAEYITNNSNVNQPILLNWFGGEPLVNIKVIDLITNHIANRGFNFTSEFTSNGYLFDERLIKKAKTKWHMTGIQITLDGTEETYNKIKNYVNPKGSPYIKVLENIQMLLNNGISVSIRLNVGEENGDNLLELIDELNLVFGAKSGLQVYCRALFDDDNIKTKDQNEKIYGYVRAIEDRLLAYNFRVGKYCSDYMMTSQCMADDGHSILIDPIGRIGTCEHYLDKDFFGDINKRDRNLQILKEWHEYMPDLDICANCPIYADCLRPNKCLELRHCDEVIKQYRTKEYEIGLKQFYIDYRMQNMLPNVLML